jgi:hypothetical protein
MVLLSLASLFSFVLFIFMLVRTWKSSILLAILSFLLWPVIIVALIKNWNDAESDIKVPFFLWVVTSCFMVWLIARMEKASQDQEALLGVMRLVV